MDQATHNKIVSFIWGIADDVLRDLFRRGKYPDVILPMCVLRRLDAVLEPTKKAVLETRKMLDDAGITEQTAALCSASGQAFYNTSKFTLYWQVGEYIGRKIETNGWGKGTIQNLGSYLQKAQLGICGFSPQNIWRMRQFYQSYREQPILSALLRELPWTHHMLILGRAKMDEEREFYIRLAAREKWSSRELERQLNTARFERTILNPIKVSAVLQELHPKAANIFKDIYSLEFLGLPAEHSEADLHGGLLRNLGRFITELGRDFCFIGSEHPIQVGGQDFSLDLLFFHRGLNCLIAIELKIRDFRPEDLGKLNFYLEALDRDHRKPHENPSIGLLLCATKDQEVVEYALSRSLSPALIAEYETLLPDKALLRAKLHEFYQLCAPPEDELEQETDGLLSEITKGVAE